MISGRHFIAGALWVGCVAAQCLAASPSPAAARELLRNLPLHFEPNQGQWNSSVRFAARMPEYTLALEDRRAVLRVPGSPDVAITLAGANPRPEIRGADPLPSRSNYFTGERKKDWRAGVPHYAKVRYSEAWPGIDVVYYGNRGRLEYDFVLRPGADPDDVRLRFRGARRIRVTAGGDLELETPAGLLVQRKPVIWQQEEQVEGRYRLLARDTVGIEVAAYDPAEPLTIDPVLEYATLLGGNGTDAVTAVQFDQNGIVYVAGYITTGGLEQSGGAMLEEFGGSVDAFLAKLDPRQAGGASLVYFTFFGGSGEDRAKALALDASGFIYLAGSTTSSNFPLAGATPQTAPGSTETPDAFVVKLHPALNGTESLFYSTFLGGSAADEATGVAVDAAGAIYVAGTTRSEDFPLSSAPAQGARWGGQDGFIAKIVPDASPSLVYSSFFGGNSYDTAEAIAVTPGGQVYLAGSTISPEFPWTGVPYQFELRGGSDIWIAWIDPNVGGTAGVLYSSWFGGGGNDELNSMTLDPEGKLLLTGITLSEDFPVTPDALQPSYAGQGDAFVVRFDPAVAGPGALLYGTYFGAGGGDSAHNIAPDGQGGVYLTGYTMSRDFPVTADALRAEYGTGIEVFLARLDLTRAGGEALTYATYLGTLGIHVGEAVTVGPDGSVCVVGYTGPLNVSVSEGAVQPEPAGGISDGFVLVLTP